MFKDMRDEREPNVGRRFLLKGLLAAPILGIRGIETARAAIPTMSSSQLKELEVSLKASTGPNYGADACEVLNSAAELESYCGAAARVYLKTVCSSGERKSRFYVRRVAGSGAMRTADNAILEDALARCWMPDPAELVDLRKFGSLKGSDATALFVRALEKEGVYVWVPPDLRISVTDVPLGSQRTIVVDGTIELSQGSPRQATVFANADVQSGNSHIVIVGKGEITGARENQVQNAEHELLRFVACSFVTLNIARAGSNRYCRNDHDHSGAAIHIIGGSDHTISVERLVDYGREGVWLYNVSDSTVKATKTYGGSDSWSGVQVGGPSSAHNKIEEVVSYFAGASGIGCDSQNSLVVDCESHANRYFHGFNFGHAKQPADNTVGLRLLSVSAGTKGVESADFNGFSVVNGSVGVRLIGCSARQAFRDGFNVSAGADDCMLYQCIAGASGRYGLNASHATVLAQQCDFSGNTKGPMSPPSEGRITVQ